MKARLTMPLSLGGVLLAGSIAAIVNSQVLTAGAGSRPGEITAVTNNIPAVTAPPTVTAPPAETTLPAGNGPSADTAPTVGTMPSVEITAAAATAPTAPPVETQGQYQIGDAGLVTLDTIGEVLTIVAVNPNAGWTVIRTANNGPLNAEVELQSSTTLVKFRANLLLGVISTSVESKNLAAMGSGAAGPPPAAPTAPGSTVSPSGTGVEDDWDNDPSTYGGDDDGGDDHADEHDSDDDGNDDHAGGDDHEGGDEHGDDHPGDD